MVSALTTGGRTDPNDAIWPIAYEGIRDIQVIEHSLRYLRQLIPSEELRPRLQRVVKDSVLSTQDIGSSSFGRDVQSELFVASVCARASMRPKFAEPDVVCYVGKHTFGLAVKRPKGMQTFEDNFRKAVEQIEKSSRIGVIVMDMSLAFNPDNKPLIGSFTAEVREAKRWRALEFLDRWSEKMKAWVGTRQIRAFLIIEHIPTWLQSDGHWSLATLTDAIHFSSYNQRRHREFTVLWDAFQRGLPSRSD
jgi:hypothetical protein